jgi:hypothetical protein
MEHEDISPDQSTHLQLPEALQRKVSGGADLAELDTDERTQYYHAVCKSLGLNPLTKPFEWLTLNNKLRLYALRDCADQLRRIHGISIYITNRERVSDVYVVTARAKDRTGREDESTGAVSLGNLKGDALANALMKAETKSKRRVTLSIAGLGFLDEIELETVADRKPPTTQYHPTSMQIDSLIEMAKGCGVDLATFGQHMRRLIDLPDDTKITKKFLHETMTMIQYEAAWQHYSELLKKQVEESLEETDEGQGANVPAPAQVIVPEGLDCDGIPVSDLRPAQTVMLLSQVEHLRGYSDGERWETLLQALRTRHAEHTAQKPKKVEPPPDADEKKATLVTQILALSDTIPADMRRAFMKQSFEVTSQNALRALPYDALERGFAYLQELVGATPDEDDVEDVFLSQVDVTAPKPPILPASAVDADGDVIPAWVAVLERRAKHLGMAAEEKLAQELEASPAMSPSNWERIWVLLGQVVVPA